ncbi:MAG: EmrB/QacA family drug resistance transporter, partial [Acidocella sp.]|nr:EmrB/QacA family drug resistance transporter [Acidocella sp.]
TPDEARASMIITLIIQGAGLGSVFVPLQIIAFYTVPGALRTQGTALLSLMRNVGSAIGIAVTSAMLDRMTHYEHAVLTQFVTPFARPLQTGGAVSRMLNPNTPAGAALLDSTINTQAQIIAYIDDYKLMLLSTLPAMACLLLMRKPPVIAPASHVAPLE